MLGQLVALKYETARVTGKLATNSVGLFLT